MAAPGKAIHSLLANDATVSGLVSARVYPNTIPTTVAYPAVMYSKVSEEFRESKDGPIPTGRYTFQLDIYAETYTIAQDITDACASVLDWYTGTVESQNISRITKLDESDVTWEDDKELFHIVQDYNLRLKI